LGPLGDFFIYKNFQIFFGNKKADTSVIEFHFPEHEQHLLRQTHSDILLESQSGPLREGDAHWSQDKNRLLLIKTADCMPVLIASPKQGIALAIHAGWRGVAQQIIEKSIRNLKLQQDPDLAIWIGPHIQMENFEVDGDVAKQILNAYGISLDSALDPLIVIKKGPKFYIDLAKLVETSLIKMGILKKNIFISPKDTRASDEYYSYRRGERGVSNYSFITKTS
jgi:polyphenol oxidase